MVQWRLKMMWGGLALSWVTLSNRLRKLFIVLSAQSYCHHMPPPSLLPPSLPNLAWFPTSHAPSTSSISALWFKTVLLPESSGHAIAAQGLQRLLSPGCSTLRLTAAFKTRTWFSCDPSVLLPAKSLQYFVLWKAKRTGRECLWHTSLLTWRCWPSLFATPRWLQGKGGAVS